MAIESAEVSLTGDREDNQDRAAIAVADGAALIVVMDGMGGHAWGARAAETACKVMLESFRAEKRPLFDPLGFLHLSLGRAHEAVVAIGTKLAIDVRPRATCAVCLVQRGEAYWAHIGDSRVYHLRNGTVVSRTRDHSHVEQLLRAYHERYPKITSLIEIGRTRQNRAIWALKISDDDASTDLDEPAVLFNAAHHGSELLSIEYVLDAIDQLLTGHRQDPQITAWIEGLEIWCVPLVNVDGTGLRQLATLAADDPAFAWSPDGSSLAALGGDAPWLLPLDGSAEPTQLSHGSYGSPDWRP